MDVHISYKTAKTPDIDKEFTHHLEKLRKRLQVFRPDLVRLHAYYEQERAREGTTVSLNLRLPSGQMTAKAVSKEPVSAVKMAFDDLVQQVTRHKELLRSPRRRGRGRVPVESHEARASTPVEVPVATASDISSWLNANLTRLNRFVERELRYRESLGLLEPDQLMPDEVVDEAIATALGSGMEKPERLALEPWLFRLAVRSLSDLALRSAESPDEVSLDLPAGKRNVTASDEPHLQYHQPDESMVERDVIADRRVASPEDSAASDEMVALVELALKGAKPEDREAFLLLGIEGFSPEEIAAITDRPIERVLASITTAREHLRKFLPKSYMTKEKPLASIRTA